MNLNSFTFEEYCDLIEYNLLIEKRFNFKNIPLDENENTIFDVDDLIIELKKRLDRYAPFEPFEIKKRSIEIKIDSKSSYFYPYFYCLYYALDGGVTAINVTNIFEKLTQIALSNYFSNSKSIFTSIGQNSKLLKNSISDLAKEIKENIGDTTYMPEQTKDGGVDIVTFMPIDDRGNQLICLTDATIGKHWRTEKVVNSKLKFWEKYIHFLCTPLTCLSIVHVVKTEEFFEASNNNGLIFDRTRVLKYYREDLSVKKELTNWYSTICSS